MRKLTVAVLLALAAGTARAQVPDSAGTDTAGTTDALPRAIAREVVARFNRPVALRVHGAATVARDDMVGGDVAVLHGPLTVAGEIAGDIVAINADVVLQPTARVRGSLYVVGGAVQGATAATVAGSVVVHPQALAYHEEGERIVLDVDGTGDARGWERWLGRRSSRRGAIRLASARTYNRVEGLPIYLGPAATLDTDFGSVEVDAFGIIRTAEEFRWDSDNLGHLLRTEVRFGDDAGVTLGGRLYDIVDPVQEWELTDAEVGLASFFLHRDYRDYFDRHGGGAFIGLNTSRDASLRLTFARERWNARDVRDPFTVFRNGQAWRPNPRMDEGHFDLVNATYLVDTRNEPADPWSGWYITADLEAGSGTVTTFGPASPLARSTPGSGQVNYRRAFLDLRRYNRISPSAGVNLRLVLGGWIGGDELPLQRRFALGGPGSLPGFDFRGSAGGEPRLHCGSGDPLPGNPAQCERLALAQVEYRGDLDLLGLFNASERVSWGLGGNAQWIVFADAGRGWLVGPRLGTVRYPTRAVPALGTFETDAGVGLDLGIIGLYVAKALSAGEPANFFVRVRHRF